MKAEGKYRKRTLGLILGGVFLIAVGISFFIARNLSNSNPQIRIEPIPEAEPKASSPYTPLQQSAQNINQLEYLLNSSVDKVLVVEREDGSSGIIDLDESGASSIVEEFIKFYINPRTVSVNIRECGISKRKLEVRFLTDETAKIPYDPTKRTKMKDRKGRVFVISSPGDFWISFSENGPFSYSCFGKAKDLDFFNNLQQGDFVKIYVKEKDYAGDEDNQLAEERKNEQRDEKEYWEGVRRKVEIAMRSGIESALERLREEAGVSEETREESNKEAKELVTNIFDNNWDYREKKNWEIFPNKNLAVKVYCFQENYPETFILGNYKQTLDYIYLICDIEVRALKGTEEVNFLGTFEISDGNKGERTYNEWVMKTYEKLNPGKGEKRYHTISDAVNVGSNRNATQKRKVPFLIAYETTRGTILDPPADYIDFIPKLTGVIWLVVGNDSIQLTSLDLKPRYGYVKERKKIE